MRYNINNKTAFYLGVLSILTGLSTAYDYMAGIRSFSALSLATASVIFIITGLFLTIKHKGLNDLAAKTHVGRLRQTDPFFAPDECDGDFRELIEQNKDALYVLNRHGKIIDVNMEMSRITGFSKKELLKLKLSDLIDPAQLVIDPVSRNLKDLFEPRVTERRLQRKDGSVVEVQINAKTITGDRVLVIAHDLTAARQKERELEDAESKFRALAENSRTGIYIIQKEKLTYINLRFAEIFGYAVDELLRPDINFIELIISAGYRGMLRKNIQARLKGEIKFAAYDIVGLKKDGHLNYLELSGNTAVINNEPTVIGTLTDVTQRWHLEQRLQRADAGMQAILDTTDTAYIILNPELEIMALNPIAVDFVERQYHHTLKAGDQFKDHFSPGETTELFQLIKQVLLGDTTNYEIHYTQPDGITYWYHVRLSPVIDNQNNITGVLMALADVTGRKNIEQDLQTAYTRIHDHIKNITEMVWKQSHLIRSPLANLKGLVMLLRSDPQDKTVLDYLQQELERLDQVIGEMAAEAKDLDQ